MTPADQIIECRYNRFEISSLKVSINLCLDKGMMIRVPKFNLVLKGKIGVDNLEQAYTDMC